MITEELETAAETAAETAEPAMESFDLSALWESLLTSGVDIGKKILAAFVVYFIGRYIIKFISRLIKKLLDKRNIAVEIKSFLDSVVSFGLNVLLVISVIGCLGVETTSFAALLASVGVAIGMALSGQTSNFAGGILLLLQRPYKIGDYIETNGVAGTVDAIQIFSTRIITVDNKVIIIPNGSITGGVITNYSQLETRRVDFSFGVEYGQDLDQARATLLEVINNDARILKDPEPFIKLGELADSSVNITVRVWVKSGDYWGVFFDMNEMVYKTFNARNIGFPFPQVTVHQAND